MKLSGHGEEIRAEADTTMVTIQLDQIWCAFSEKFNLNGIQDVGAYIFQHHMPGWDGRDIDTW